MAKNQTKRLSPAQIQLDIESYDALVNIDKYAPANPAYSKENATSGRTGMGTSQQKETQSAATLAADRDDATADEWKFHNIMLGVKDQVVAQFGRDSNEAQAIGLKKKSEYKTRTKKKPAK